MTLLLEMRNTNTTKRAVLERLQSLGITSAKLKMNRQTLEAISKPETATRKEIEALPVSVLKEILIARRKPIERLSKKADFVDAVVKLNPEVSKQESLEKRQQMEHIHQIPEEVLRLVMGKLPLRDQLRSSFALNQRGLLKEAILRSMPTQYRINRTGRFNILSAADKLYNKDGPLSPFTEAVIPTLVSSHNWTLKNPYLTMERILGWGSGAYGFRYKLEMTVPENNLGLLIWFHYKPNNPQETVSLVEFIFTLQTMDKVKLAEDILFIRMGLGWLKKYFNINLLEQPNIRILSMPDKSKKKRYLELLKKQLNEPERVSKQTLKEQ